MFTPSRISPSLGVTAVGLALCWAASAASADGPGLGKPVTEADIAAWDISIEPSGKGSPPGAGTPVQGAHIYVEKCAACHGPEGKTGVTGGDGGAIAAVGRRRPDHRHLGRQRSGSPISGRIRRRCSTTS